MGWQPARAPLERCYFYGRYPSGVIVTCVSWQGSVNELDDCLFWGSIAMRPILEELDRREAERFQESLLLAI